MKRSTAAPPRVTAERFSPEVYRLRMDGQIIGFAMLLTNGRWIHTDTEDRRQGTETWASPRDVATAVAKSIET